jgi:hypothetical protein
LSNQPIQNKAQVNPAPDTVSNSNSNRNRNRNHAWELLAAATFVVVHLTSPLWIGELYPFTISPMFCDSPRECCRYEVFAADGTPLDARRFNLHTVYDGNPPGLGMGIVAAPTLHGFGEVASQQQVVDHVRSVLKGAAADQPNQVVVHQHHFFSADNQIKHQKKVWTINALETGE